MSVFIGPLDEFSRVSVDRFDYVNLNSTVFLLSHFHSDHTQGLDALPTLKTDSNWRLYLSEPTAHLLLNNPRYSHLSPFLVPLPLHDARIIDVPRNASKLQHDSISINEKDSGLVSGGDSYLLTLTLLPAAHCIGSVMFLLEGARGTILYTGDCRLPTCQLRSYPALFTSSGELKRITRLYMDTTFCNERIPTLPTREQCAEFVLRKSREWLSRGPQSSGASNGSATHFYASGAEESSVPSAAHCVRLLCATRYILSGLYELLERELGECVHVNAATFSELRGLPDAALLTRDASSTRLHHCDDAQQQFGPCASACAMALAAARAPREPDKNAKPSPPEERLCCCFDSERYFRHKGFPTDMVSSVRREPRVLTFILSTLWFVVEGRTATEWQCRIAPRAYRALFSMHMSYEETRALVEYLRPERITPCVVPVESTAEEITSVLHSMWFALRPVPRPLGDRSRASERSEAVLSALPTMRTSSASDGARHPSQDSSASCFGVHAGSRPTLRSIRSLRFQQQMRASLPSESSSSTASPFTSSANCSSEGSGRESLLTSRDTIDDPPSKRPNFESSI